jgi:hypothetical protein
MKAFISWMVPKADMHGRMNAAKDRMSRAAGLNKSVPVRHKKTSIPQRYEGFYFLDGAKAG